MDKCGITRTQVHTTCCFDMVPIPRSPFSVSVLEQFCVALILWSFQTVRDTPIHGATRGAVDAAQSAFRRRRSESVTDRTTGHGRYVHARHAEFYRNDLGREEETWWHHANHLRMRNDVAREQAGRSMSWRHFNWSLTLSASFAWIWNSI